MASTPSPALDNPLTIRNACYVVPLDLEGFQFLTARFLVFENLLSKIPSRTFTAQMTKSSERVATLPSFTCPLPPDLRSGARGLFNLNKGLSHIPMAYDWAFFQGEDIRRACEFSVLVSPRPGRDHLEVMVDIKIYKSSALVAFQVLAYILMQQAPVVGSVVVSIFFAGMEQETAAIICGAGLAIVPHYLMAMWIAVFGWITGSVEIYQQFRLGTFFRWLIGNGAVEEAV